MIVLVTGGAGYIGSHTLGPLESEGFTPLVLDNFSGGRREFVGGRRLVEGDLLDKDVIRKVFAENSIAGVLHFASLIQVAESCADPRKYYTHNILASLNLLDVMLEFGVKVLIFSSSAAVYGVPEKNPIPETHPVRPVNPYGQTKAVVERVLEDYGRAYGLRSVSLRYFNAAGADPSGKLGEAHDPETHLIPNIMRSILGERPALEVFGTDFPTPDGTAVRDYVHVADLASAHVLALKSVLGGGPGGFLNLGTGRGFSVREVVRTTEAVTGRPVPTVNRPRREGDVPVLLASKEKAERDLGWRLRSSELETIIESAWRWHSRAKS
jgi:UDP-glucose-4-epimerase GalE